MAVPELMLVWDRAALGMWVLSSRESVDVVVAMFLRSSLCCASTHGAHSRRGLFETGMGCRRHSRRG